ncbi:Cupredoxin [Infundibulicybe gibba]|nr:Cupredoxin [Infundibulicybe gibba]
MAGPMVNIYLELFSLVEPFQDPLSQAPSFQFYQHWHGFFQKGSNWADGPAFVTQCPIAPSHSFQYDFRAADQAGTFGTIRISVEYDIDDESTVITLGDWYHVPAKSAGLVPTAASTLINGKGRYASGPAIPLTTVIEADGISTEPLVVDSIQIFAGQRYSFVLSANQPVGNYWIRAKPNLPDLGTTPLMAGSIRPSCATQTQRTRSQPPHKGPAPPHSSRRTSIPSRTPVHQGLQIPAILSGKKAAQDLLPAGDVYTLPPNKVIEISIPGGAPGSPCLLEYPKHPFHLHGVRRDVVSTGLAGDNVTIRFTTDNPGPWILHCHIDWHLEIGLAVVLAEAPDQTIRTPSIPPALEPALSDL